MNTPTATPDFAPITPRVWQINLLRDRVPALLADIDAWRTATRTPLQFSGVLRGHYARLYLSLPATCIPADLEAIVLRYIPNHSGSVARSAVWGLSSSKSRPCSTRPRCGSSARWRDDRHSRATRSAA